MKKLNISLDPGFDGFKMIINGHDCNIPFMAEDVTGKESFSGASLRPGYLSYIEGEKKYIVGEVAKLATLESSHVEASQDTLDDFYSLEPRFRSNIFRVIVNAGLGAAMLEYAALDKIFKIEELSNYEIRVVVALPHKKVSGSSESSLWDIVKPVIIGEHRFSLASGHHAAVDISFSIDENNVFYQSQTICVLYNEYLDENGNQKENATDSLPSLIIDGGYKTVGEALLSRTLSVDKGDSNTDYAMLNINEMVAAAIKEKTGKPIQSYSVEVYARQGIPVRYIDKNGKAVEIDVKATRNDVIKKMESDYLEHLLKKFDDLTEVNSIYVAGGTGKVYYDYINAFCEKNRPYLAGKVKQSIPVFNGKELSPVFAIAAGGYKMLIQE